MGKLRKPGVSIVWFKLDLRLRDNPALAAATAAGAQVVSVYIWSPAEAGAWSAGAASRWWLHQSLKSLDADLRERGTRLIIRKGEALKQLRLLVHETGARCVFWNRTCEDYANGRDRRVEVGLLADGIAVETFNGGLLFEPAEILNSQGGAYQVFTPFWNRCLSVAEPVPPLAGPKLIVPPEKKLDSLPLESLELEPRVDWAVGLRECWTPGELGARKRLQSFLKSAMGSYSTSRDRPDREGVSMLSPHLHFGEMSIHQLWHSVKKAGAEKGNRNSAEVYLKELGWREFAHYILFHFPKTSDQPLRDEFLNFPWAHRPSDLERWQKGATGYPIVDAGMRQLWKIGWMHNRVRMIVASFLTKDLLVPWIEGARWFWDTLVDADLANNTLGWQWAAGCGADAAPYFRIFNPELQGRKFDPEGNYVREFVPELSRLPAQWIHKPWKAPVSVLRRAGVVLGESYPQPIVDHGVARLRALEAFAQVRAKD
jgi:deoxyribodipyrimidine photo-lyase